jgi:AAA15 family ATPase/GTPase
MNIDVTANEMTGLISFMNGLDGVTLKRLLSYFSHESRYLHPRELKEFWDSLTESEKNYYRRLVVYRII